MNIKEYVKRNTARRIFAIVLLIGCVLPLIPSELFADWLISPIEQQTVSHRGGNGSLTFRYFANDLYVPAQGQYQYYTVDAYNNGGDPFYTGGQLNLENNAAAVKEKLEAAGVAPGYTASYTATVTATSDQYCTDGRNTSYDCGKYDAVVDAQTLGTASFSAQATVSVGGIEKTVQMGSVAISVTFGDASTSIRGYQTTTADDLSLSSAVSVDDASGAMLYAIPASSTSEAPASATATVSNGDSHVCGKTLGIFDKKHNAKVCNYSCQASYALSYHAFIEVPPRKGNDHGR